MEPVNVTEPSARVIKSVWLVWPIVVSLIITFSTVSVVNVPKDVIADWAACVTVNAVPEALPVTLPVTFPVIVPDAVKLVVVIAVPEIFVPCILTPEIFVPDTLVA